MLFFDLVLNLNSGPACTKSILSFQRKVTEDSDVVNYLVEFYIVILIFALL